MLNNITAINEQASIEFCEQLQKMEHKRLIDSSLVEELTNSEYTIRVASYVRVSTKGQAEKDKVSLREQGDEIIRHSNDHKWQIVASYKDAGISGTHINGRTGFQSMIEDAKKGNFDLILAWNYSRLARNALELMNLKEELKSYSVQLAVVNENTVVQNPRLYAHSSNQGYKKMPEMVSALRAEDENVTRVEQFNLGKRGYAKNGKIPCRAPYGYRRYSTYDSLSRKKIYHADIQEDEGQVVQLIFDKYDKENKGIRKIAEEINGMKSMSPTGKTWSYSSVKYVLQNPTYIGVVRWGWRLSKSKESRTRLETGHQGLMVPGMHRAIIMKDLFVRVQQKLANRKKLGGRASSSKGLLVGIAKCGRCGGGTYVTEYPNWHTYKKPKNERLKYKNSEMYMCSSYSSRGRSGCTKRWVMYRDKLERLVLEKIIKLANSESAREAYLSEMTRTDTNLLEQEIRVLKDSISKLQDKRNRQKEAYYNGVITMEEYTTDTKELDKDILKDTKELEGKTYTLESILRKSTQIVKITSLINNFKENWENANLSLKKELMLTILEKVIVYENRVDIIFKR